MEIKQTPQILTDIHTGNMHIYSFIMEFFYMYTMNLLNSLENDGFWQNHNHVYSIMKKNKVVQKNYGKSKSILLLVGF